MTFALIQPGARVAPAAAPAWAVAAVWWVGLTALFVLTHPYGGIDGDARLYVGSALAALDPGGIGQDLMFRHDGQFGFSLYPPLLKALAARLGPSPAALVISLAGAAAWLTAAAALARALAPRRPALAFAVAACMIVMPAHYGGFGAFGYGEILAVPRPFAEAGVMAGLAALLAGRRGLALALMVAAAAFHPIMALPGFVAGLAMLALRDRRWLLVPILAGAGVLVAALLGAPLADRLLIPVDDAWLAVLRLRAADLFPLQWPAEAWGRLIVHLGTIGLAATLVSGRRRDLLLAIALAGAAGWLVSVVLGDRLPMLLIVQLQPWRALWLLALTAHAALALAGVRLWRAGGASRLLLAGTAVAWMAIETPAVAAGVMALVLGARLLQRRRRLPPVTPLIAGAAWAATTTLALVWLGQRAWHLLVFIVDAHRAGADPGWPYVLAPELHTLPLAALAIALASLTGVWTRGRIAAAAVLAIAAAAGALALWDGRLDGRRMIDTLGRPAALTAALGPGRGAVMWVGGDTEAWLLAGRPNWANRMQAGGAVFSRDLALAWRRRLDALVEGGLADAGDLAPFTGGGAAHRLLIPSPAAVGALCRQADGPAAVVAPEALHRSTPEGFRDIIWRAPVATDLLSLEHGAFVWRRVASYTIIPCPRDVSAARP